MTLLEPAWLWLLPIALPLLVLLHLRRRRDVVVASLLVWRTIDVAASAAPSRRRIAWRDPHLWLQAFTLTALVAALAQPALGSKQVEHWIVLVDASSSMAASDVEPNRFESALADVLETFGRGDVTADVSLVHVGTRARVVATRWPAGRGLQGALTGLTISEGQPDWPGAAIRADLLAKGAADVRFVVFTDPIGADAARTALVGAGLDQSLVDVVTVGQTILNVGLGDVAASPRGERSDQWVVTGNVESIGFVRGDTVRVVAAYRPSGTSTFLPWGGADVTLEGDGTGTFAIPLDVPGPGEVEIRGPTGDQLGLDDSAFVELKVEPTRVAVLGDPHPALLRALASLDGIEVYAVDQVPEPAAAALFDLVIITENVEGIPATSTLWLGAVPDAVANGEPLTGEPLPLAAHPHVLSSDIDALAISLTGAQPLRLLPGAAPLLSAGDMTLAWARTTDVGRQVVLGFGLDDGDWASQLSFPAFLAGVVDWAAPGRAAANEPACRVGEPCAWPREAFRGQWVLRDPGGEVVVAGLEPVPVTNDPLAQAVWSESWFDAGFLPRRRGQYVLAGADAAVNVVVAGEPVGRPPEASATESSLGLSSAGWPLWRWLIGAATLALLLETVLALIKQDVVVRRRWHGPLALAVGAALALTFALVGLPIPAAEAGGHAIWVGSFESQEGFRAAHAGSIGWAWSWVERLPAFPAEAEAGTARSSLLAPDLPLAIEVALSLPASIAPPQVVIAGHGQATLGTAEALELLGRAASVGAVLGYFVDDPDPLTHNVSLDDLRLGDVNSSSGVRAGAPFEIVATVHAPEGTNWTLRAELSAQEGQSPDRESTPRAAQAGADLDSGPAGQRAAALTASAAGEVDGAGTTLSTLKLEAGEPGQLVYRLTLRQEGSEQPSAEAVVTVDVGAHLSVLMVATDDVQGQLVAEALSIQGLAVTRTTPFRMPSSLAGLTAFDVLALVNVPASEMFPEYLNLIERYVREEGRGLLLFGGSSAFGPGGYYSTSLEEISPLSARIDEEAPEIAMAFVLDRSGSMSGAVGTASRMDVAKAATVEALALLGEKSFAALIVFDNEARVVMPLTPVSDVTAFQQALASVSPAGGTSIYPGLVAALQLMAESDSATRHVVVMTDGLSAEADFAGVLTALQDLGVSTSFVGVGDTADRRQLTTLAGLGGGALHMARDFRALPGLLAQEALMQAATPIEEGVTVSRWAGDSLPEFLADIVGGAPPPLLGYVQTTAKDEASVHLVASANDDPLLASWRYGLGRVVAFTSEVDGPWAQEWLSTPFYGRLWSQVARWVAERPVRDTWSLEVGGDEGVLDVLVDVPVNVRATSHLPLVELRDREGVIMARRQLTRIAPARAAARFEVADDVAGVLEVIINPVPELGLKMALSRTLPWPLPAGKPVRFDLVSVSALANATGGEVYGSDGVLLGSVAPTFAWRSLPEIWLLLGLVAFLTSLAVRYGSWSVLSTWLNLGARERTRTT